MVRATMKAGRDRWLPNQEQDDKCRVQGRDSPVLHEHDYITQCINKGRSANMTTRKLANTAGCQGKIARLSECLDDDGGGGGVDGKNI